MRKNLENLEIGKKIFGRHPAKGSRGQYLRFIWIIFLFVPVKSTEIPGDIPGYETAIKNKLFSIVI